MSKIDIYGLGNALVDYECRVDEKFLEQIELQKGVMTLVDKQQQAKYLAALENVELKRACGGSAANSVIAAAHLGASACYSFKTAADEDGKFYRRDLENAGVKCATPNATEDGITGKCTVFVTADAERTMATYLGITATLDEKVLDAKALQNSKYLYIEGYLLSSDTAKKAAIKAKQIAQKSATKVALSLSDPNMVKHFKADFLELIDDGIDIIFANIEEAMMMSNTNSAPAALVALKPLAKVVVITMGQEGSLVFDGEEEHKIAAVHSEVIDTLGAGDIYAGAFLAGLSQGMSAKKAANLASLAAARLVAHFGPRLSKQQMADVLAEFAAQN